MVDDTKQELSMQDETVASGQQWQRVAKLAIVDLLFKFLWRLLKENWAVFAPLAIYVGTFKDNSLVYLVLGALLIVTAVIVYAILYYLAFEYCLDEKRSEILLKRGVFVNDRITLAFSRVQNVNQSQPFYLRPFRLVNLSLDSAGSAGKEIFIPGLKQNQAQTIVDSLRTHRDSHENASIDQLDTIEEDSTQQSEYKFNLGMGELIRFGLSNQGVLAYVFAGLVPALRAMGIKISDVYADFVTLLSVYIEHPSIHTDTVFLKVLFLVLLFLLCQVAVVAYSVLRHWGYSLNANEENLEKSSGLTERQQVSVKKRKVQALAFYQNVIAYFLGFYRVRFLQVSQRFGTDQNQHFILPYLKKDRWRNLAQAVFSKEIENASNTLKPKYQLLMRYFVFFGFLPAAAIAIYAVLSDHIESLYLLLPITLGLILWYRRYRSWSLQEIGDYTLVRSAWIGELRYLFPNHKIQSLSISQSYWQKRSGLCNLSIQLSSKRLTLPYLSYSCACQFVNQRLWEIESRNDKWC